MSGFNDDAQDRWDAAQRRVDRLIRGLEPEPDERSPEQLPLYPALPQAEVYPLNALGPTLAKAARAIAAKVQLPEAIAANSVLAAASLAAQAHADVCLPYRQNRPLSLYLVTIAGSGDRKSTADREALLPIALHEKALQDIYESERQRFLVEFATWNAEKRKIEAERKLDFATRKHKLEMLGPAPEPPLLPFLVAPDPTYEGLVKALPTARPSLGVFSPEGGQFVGGYGLSQDNRLRTAAGFSLFWDGQPIKRVRALDGVSILGGRRLAMHLMVQPEVSSLLLSDPVLRSQGLLSRLLVAAPESLAGTRPYREPRLDEELAIGEYSGRILTILQAEAPASCDRSQGLSPCGPPFSPGALGIWTKFYNGIERLCGPAGRYCEVRDLASKIAEHAARIAGVLAIIEDLNASGISDACMASGVILAQWYLDEAVRLQTACKTDVTLLKAQRLLDWLRAQGAAEVRFADVVQSGPGATRTKKEAEAALAILQAHGWVEEVGSRPRTVRVLRPGDRH